MASAQGESTGLSFNFVPALLRRNPIPDVPEDIDHFNDPNWDYSQPDTATTAVDDPFELHEKKSVAASSRYSMRSSEVGTESQTEETYKSTGSRLHLQAAQTEEEYDDESPYAEVRASVSNTDDPSIPVSTFRMWFVGMFLTIVMSSINHMFQFRYPSVILSSLVMQLIALPFGKAMEWLLPTRRFTTFGYTWSLNPGPFNVKEHTCISAMANVVYNDAYVTAVTATQVVFYGSKLTFSYKFLIVLSTQLLGYSFAGLVRQFLVWPASMIWPGALVNCALLNTLHKNYGRKEKNHMTREKFFTVVLLCGAVWYFVPGFLFTALSMFTWVCWIAPQNQTVNTLFGYQTGLGMGFLTFDWSMISFLGSPLVTPWWAEANEFAGFLFFMWFLAPIFYFKNFFFAQFMPISAAIAFDNTGSRYNVQEIITNGVFDEEKYRAYSPLYLSTTFAVSYGVQFASFIAVLVHVFLWYRRDIIRQFGRSLKEERDVHARLMSVYSEVPHWWYAGVGLVSFVFGVVAIKIYPTEFPVWAYILSILLGLVFMLPIGIIRAVTNQLVGLNVFTEFVVGYMLPGRPVAMMLFKTYGFTSMVQGLSFTSDLKIGHYMKIPPRVLFLAQTIATIVASFVIIATQEWLFDNIEGICTPHAKDNFTCPQIQTFATASIIWGAIGPRRIFSPGALYSPLLWFLLVGALVPVPFYILARRYPRSYWRYINIPVFFAGLGQMPPASGINYSSAACVGFIFQWFIRRYHFRWWMRYNYILSAGLDAGVMVGALLVFFCLQLPRGGVELNWWGNTVWQNTFDSQGMPAQFPDANGTFGLKTWS